MLQFLQIRNLAIVDELQVEFENGFNVITGETGAGKSVIIGALMLILGERADKSCIRSNTERCEITGMFNFNQSAPILEKLNILLDEQGIEKDDNSLIIRRVITNSSTRSFINNTAVPLSTVKDIGNLLVAMHGPNDNQGLAKSNIQRDLLDSYGNHHTALVECENAYIALQKVEDQINQIHREIPNRQQFSTLKMQLEDIEAINPQNNEDVHLKEQHDIVANSNRILEIINMTVETLSGNDGCVIDQLTLPSRWLMELEKLDVVNGEGLKTRLFEIIDLVNDFSNELETYGSRVDINAEEFANLEERMRQLSSLKRKYGPSLNDVLLFKESALEKILLFDNSTEMIARLNDEKKVLAQELHNSAQKLSQLRKKSAASLAKKVTDKLSFLGFKKSEFEIEMCEGELRSDGFDIIDFTFSPNVGEPLQSLKKIASSGEISRVMLALKTVLASADHTSLLVFDEIDANVGGKVANMVGSELASLGKSHQVLCISHLPQVAASGNVHFCVEKEIINERTKTKITRLSEHERVNELTRMLGGDETSQQVIEHAKAMLDGSLNFN